MLYEEIKKADNIIFERFIKSNFIKDLRGFTMMSINIIGQDLTFIDAEEKKFEQIHALNQGGFKMISR
jgi:hypothetical protein